MTLRIARWLSIIILLCLTLVSGGAQVAAQSTTPATPVGTPAPAPRFAIQPVGDYPNGYFEITLKPGESMQLTANVLGVDSASVKLRAYATNALNIVNGGFAAGDEKDAPSGATTWLDFKAESFQITGNEQKKMTFSVTVPKDAKPGQYVAALVAQTDGPIAIPGMTTFNQIIRSAISVAITVPGKVTPGFTLGAPSFDAGSAAPKLVIPVANTGNILVKPKGELTVTTKDGKPVAKAPVEMGSVYGGYTTTLEITLPEQLQPGDYLVSGKLTDPASKVSVPVDKQTATLADRNAPPPQFTLDPVSITPSGDPIQFANVAITVNNAGSNIPTAKVVLRVSKDGKAVEEYPLAQNQALPNGKTDVMQRYLPAKGWEKGTYTFEVVVSSVNAADGTEAVISTVTLDSKITVP
ncbi:MAG: WxL protein peptidoglycan domain-containing protein [Thermomicrobiales bacterium]